MLRATQGRNTVAGQPQHGLAGPPSILRSSALSKQVGLGETA